MAEEWAKARGGEIAKRQFFDYREADKFSLGDLLRKYDIEKLTAFDKHDANRPRIKKLCRHPITHIRMSAIQPADFAEFRDQRLRGGFTESRQAGRSGACNLSHHQRYQRQTRVGFDEQR